MSVLVVALLAWLVGVPVGWVGTGAYVQWRARRRAQRHAGTIGRERVGL